MIRADAATLCIDTSCGFSDTDLANAVDFAVAQGAAVINMSLGGAAPSSAALQTAIQNAVAAGVIFAIAAGNQAAANPLNPAALASDPIVNGQIIAVGASIRTTPSPRSAICPGPRRTSSSSPPLSPSSVPPSAAGLRRRAAPRSPLLMSPVASLCCSSASPTSPHRTLSTFS